MKRARLVVALALTAAFGVGCELLAGIDDRDYQVAKDSGAGDVAAPTTCDDPLPPRPTAQDEDPPTQYVFALRTYNFSGRTDGGAAIGFDLDGVCTCDPADPFHDASASCVGPDRALVEGGCDEPKGVDDGLAAVIGQFKGTPLLDLLTTTVNDDVACGRQTLLLVIDGYDGKRDDAHVSVNLLLSYGILEPHDGGTIADPRCSAASTPWPAKFDGKDIWSVPPGSVSRQTASPYPLAAALKGWVKDYELVIDTRGDSLAPGAVVDLGGRPIEASGAMLRATLVPLDGAGAELDASADTTPAGFRIANGVVSGRASADAVLTALGTFHFREDTDAGDAGDAGDAAAPPSPVVYLCDPRYALLYSGLKDTFCRGRDLRVDRADFQGLPCDAVSLTIGFDAVPAVIGTQEFAGNDAGATGCAVDFHDSCDAGSD